MEQEQKFRKFQAAVFAEVDAKVEQIRAQAQEQKEKELQQNEEEQIARASATVQKKMQEIKQESKREIAKTSLDAKRSILLKRSQLEEQIFESVRQRLAGFAASDAYEEYLLSQIAAFAKANPLPHVEILLRECDLPLAKKVQAAYSLPCEVKADNMAVGLGGFIVRDNKNGLYFDETFSQKLAEQKTYFIENSAFALS